MATIHVYDVKITTVGFFSLFSYQVHTPATFQKLTQTQLSIIEGAGWKYTILREYEIEDPGTAPTDKIQPTTMRQYIIPTITDLPKLYNPVSGDHIFVLDTKIHYLVDID